MDKVSKLQGLLPYDWRIVNELDRELTGDEYAVCISWISFMNWALVFRSQNMKEIVKPMASISKDAKLDFCNFFGLGNDEVKTIYINKNEGCIQRDTYKAKEAKNQLLQLEGVN